MVDDKGKYVFGQTFILDSEKNPVGTRLIRKVLGPFGNSSLIESKIIEYSPSGTAVRLSNIQDLTDSPLSEMWYDIELVSSTVFDIINPDVDKNPEDSETTGDTIHRAIRNITTRWKWKHPSIHTSF